MTQQSQHADSALAHDELLTISEVAAILRAPVATMRYWRHLGIGPAGIRVGRRVLYDEAECDRWWQTKIRREAQGSSA